MSGKEKEDQVEVTDVAEDRTEKRATVIELPFCTTEMGPEQARGESDSEPCDDHRTGDTTKKQPEEAVSPEKENQKD
jgi:hypothetical protein